MPRTYNNEVTTSEVSLGIERVLIGPYTATWSPARIDYASPPSGFVDLGAVVEDKTKLSVARKFYDLETGIPAVLQYTALIGLTGTFEAELYSYAAAKLQYMLGHGNTVSSSTIYTRQPFGTSQISNYAILGVADLLDGTQIIHYMKKARASADMMDAIKGKTATTIEAKWNLFGLATTVYGGSELIVAERFTFAST